MMNLLNKLELNKLKMDNKKIYVVILVFIILIYIDFKFVIGRQLQNIKNIQPKITKLKQDLNTLNVGLTKIQELQELKKKQVGTNQKPTSKVRKIISDPEMVSLLQSISEIANKDGIQIMQIKSSKEPQPKQEKLPADKFTPLVITLDLMSDYHHFGKFINDLENSQTFIAVQSFKINSQQPDYIKQRISLVLKTYVSK